MMGVAGKEALIQVLCKRMVRVDVLGAQRTVPMFAMMGMRQMFPTAYFKGAEFVRRYERDSMTFMMMPMTMRQLMSVNSIVLGHQG